MTTVRGVQMSAAIFVSKINPFSLTVRNMNTECQPLDEPLLTSLVPLKLQAMKADRRFSLSTAGNLDQTLVGDVLFSTSEGTYTDSQIRQFRLIKQILSEYI